MISAVLEMTEIVILWLVLLFISFGTLGWIFASMRRISMRPWQFFIDQSYLPRVSIIIPTYNESDLIRYKLWNLRRLEYPKDLVEMILVDSKSNDGTLEIVDDFTKKQAEMNVKVLVEAERKGKSAALNLALKYCAGDVVIVSDADCFWPRDILLRALPFLSGPEVGAISGPKTLLNSQDSWVTKTEQAYLESINTLKLGESKFFSTLLFEGGFSAYKVNVLKSFDPYNTGSDDCGTIISLAEEKHRAIVVSEAKFFTVFPTTWTEKIGMKIRRSNQIVRVIATYLHLLRRNRVKGPKRIIAQGAFLYLINPIIFVLLIAATLFLMLNYPVMGLSFLALLIPKVRLFFLEISQNQLLLVVSLFMLIFGTKYVIWRKPKNRSLVTEEKLREYDLI